jgi:hypothetical protein
MVVNPAVKPKVATAGLVLASLAALIAAVLFAVLLPAAGVPFPAKLTSGALLLAVALITGWQWWRRTTKRRAWLERATEQWKTFNDAKVLSGTTAELTLVSVDAVQPTGSWVTIRWNRFNHTQRAWLESLPEPIWPGSVLLISPDPAQVKPGAPWPDTYFIQAIDCLAWAPAGGRGAAPVTPSVMKTRNT